MAAHTWGWSREHVGMATHTWGWRVCTWGWPLKPWDGGFTPPGGSVERNARSLKIPWFLLLRRQSDFVNLNFSWIFLATPDRARREQPIGGLGLCVCARVRSRSGASKCKESLKKCHFQNACVLYRLGMAAHTWGWRKPRGDGGSPVGMAAHAMGMTMPPPRKWLAGSAYGRPRKSAANRKTRSAPAPCPWLLLHRKSFSSGQRAAEATRQQQQKKKQQRVRTCTHERHLAFF